MNAIRLLTACIAAVLAVPALGAEDPRANTASPAPAVTTWAGLHVGFHAGAGFAEPTSVATSAAPIFTGLVPAVQVSGLTAFANGVSPLGGKTSFLGGGQIGYTFQRGRVALGVETDIAGASGFSSFGGFGSLNAIGAVPVVTSAAVGSSLHYLGTVRGRLGFVATPSLLLYATGGLAYGDYSARALLAQIGTTLGRVGMGDAGVSGVRVGWTLGAGAEWMFASQWSVRVDYLYYDLGARSWASPLSVIAPAAVAGVPYSMTTQSVRATGHLLRAGLNYHFNFGVAP